MSVILVTCPACSARVKAPGGAAGRTLPCPQCSSPVHVPDDASTDIPYPAVALGLAVGALAFGVVAVPFCALFAGARGAGLLMASTGGAFAAGSLACAAGQMSRPVAATAAGIALAGGAMCGMAAYMATH